MSLVAGSFFLLQRFVTQAQVQITLGQSFIDSFEFVDRLCQLLLGFVGSTIGNVGVVGGRFQGVRSELQFEHRGEQHGQMAKFVQIYLVEFAVEAIGCLEDSGEFALSTENRHGQPASHGRMFAS